MVNDVWETMTATVSFALARTELTFPNGMASLGQRRWLPRLRPHDPVTAASLKCR